MTDKLGFPDRANSISHGKVIKIVGLDDFTHLRSFGDPDRLDFGTGHELSFVSFLLCCYVLEIFSLVDLRSLGAEVFPMYIALVRALLRKFRLEPAGSRGVWGLDDYFFLPFYWGSAQLINHESLLPSSIHDAHLIEKFRESFLYFSSIDFIMKSKSASLSATSPLLVDVSQIRTWKKINSGLLKMYQVRQFIQYALARSKYYDEIHVGRVLVQTSNNAPFSIWKYFAF